jgi:hypothetical protein
MCIDACRRRFKGTNCSFIKNDGMSLSDAGSDFDLVFSFDSLVHCDAVVLESYIPQIISLLSRRGVAFLHHSNHAAIPHSENPFGRGNVSAEAVRAIVSESGGTLLHQEIINWGSVEMIDCLTLFGSMEWHGLAPAQTVTNRRFMDEAQLIRENIAPWFPVDASATG